MSFFDSFRTLPSENAYFAALNTARGFQSCFSSIFAPYRTYVIKGGPGSGKSTLMKKIAAKADALGLPCERYYCSSDTSSLDAVALPSLSLAILDGTAPHTVEPYCPGARDRLVDLTVFWDKAYLLTHHAAILSLNQAIAKTYEEVYALMGAAAKLEETVQKAAQDAFHEDKADAVIRRFFLRRKTRPTGRSSALLPTTPLVRPIAAFGTDGPVMFDTRQKQAATVVSLQDVHDASPLFFARLIHYLDRQGCRYEVSPLPLTEQIGEIYCPDLSLLFTVLPCKEPTVTLNLDRMLTDRGRGILRRTRTSRRMSEELCELVAGRLSYIGRLHDELETYYIAATDFTGVDAYTEMLIEEIFSLHRYSV